jgi:hypothetical protein
MVFIGFRLCSIGHFTAIATCKNKGHPAARCFPMGRWFFTNTEQLNPGGMDSGQSCSNSPWSPRKPWRKLKGYGLADRISNIHKISIKFHKSPISWNHTKSVFAVRTYVSIDVSVFSGRLWYFQVRRPMGRPSNASAEGDPRVWKSCNGYCPLTDINGY